MTPAELAAMALIGQILDRPGSLKDTDIITVVMEAGTAPAQTQLDIIRALTKISAGLMHAMADQAGAPGCAGDIYASIYDAYHPTDSPTGKD